MDKSGLKKIVSDRIYASNGNNFQQLCWDVLRNEFPDLETPRPVHDLGNDGYSIDSLVFFACYAPEGHEYKTEDTLSKIENDYEKFKENWKDKYPFNKWVFLTKSNLIGKPHEKLVEMNNSNDGIKKENWGSDRLLSIIMNLDIETIRLIFNINDPDFIKIKTENNGIINNGPINVIKQVVVNKYGCYSDDESNQDTNLNILFKFISDNLPKAQTNYSEDDIRLEVRKKIDLNFKDENDRKEVEKYYLCALSLNKLIVERLQVFGTYDQKSIEILMFHKYSEFKRNSKNNIEILDKLFDFFTPNNKKLDPSYSAIVRAFVLLFFEDCTIFEKK